MTTLTAPKANMSLKIDIEQKEALKRLAIQKKRSVHYVMVDMIEKGLEEAREEAEYQEYIKNRVMKAYNNVQNGAELLTSTELKKRVMQRLEERLKNN